MITNDTDIAPAIRMAKKEHPSARITVLTPPIKEEIHDDLRNATGQPYTIRITKAKIEQSIFPFKIVKSNGKTIHIPEKWLCASSRKEDFCKSINCPLPL